MTAKNYVIAEFNNNTVECFPRCWLTVSGNEVLWPTGLSTKALENAMINIVTPEDDWEVHTLRRVLSTSGSFSGARKKAAKAEYTSCISETEPELEGKRKVVRPGRFLDNEKSFTRKVHSLCQNYSDSDDSTLEERERVTVPRFPSEATATVSAANENVRVKSRDVINTSNGPNVQKKKPTLERDNSVDSNEMFKAVLHEVQALKYEVRSLKGMIKQGQSCANCCSKKDEAVSLLSMMPINTEDEMMTLCKELEDEVTRKQLIHELSLVGGLNEIHLIRNILRRLLTNDICKEYSCCGKNGKKNLSALPVYSVIGSAVRKRFPLTSDADIRAKVGRFLTGAGDRDGGRKRRSENANAKNSVNT